MVGARIGPHILDEQRLATLQGAVDVGAEAREIVGSVSRRDAVRPIVGRGEVTLAGVHLPVADPICVEIFAKHALGMPDDLGGAAKAADLVAQVEQELLPAFMEHAIGNVV